MHSYYLRYMYNKMKWHKAQPLRQLFVRLKTACDYWIEFSFAPWIIVVLNCIVVLYWIIIII